MHLSIWQDPSWPDIWSPLPPPLLLSCSIYSPDWLNEQLCQETETQDAPLLASISAVWSIWSQVSSREQWSTVANCSFLHSIGYCTRFICGVLSWIWIASHMQIYRPPAWENIWMCNCFPTRAGNAACCWKHDPETSSFCDPGGSTMCTCVISEIRDSSVLEHGVFMQTQSAAQLKDESVLYEYKVWLTWHQIVSIHSLSGAW